MNRGYSIADYASTLKIAHVTAWLVLACLIRSATAADWPGYQHDNHRSGCTAENLAAARLVPEWHYASPQPPHPAWDGPAKWDAYAGLRGLKSMRNYDPVFHVSVVGHSLFFGSSVDDSVHCLDTRSGRENWFYTTEGAVRIAPTWADGKLFFGSDDGNAYCLNASDGRLIWKYSPGPKQALILNDGHFIPLWPCRTGLLVDRGTAYFGMGLVPWKETYLCAVDALTGQPAGPDRFVKKLEGVTLEGALLASSDKLISPQGRVAPLLFNKHDGTPLGELQGGGGCFVLLTDDARVLHGPGNKAGWIQESSEKDRSKIANFSGGKALVVRGNTAYLLTDAELIALDRTNHKDLWRRPSDSLHGLILAGDVLYAGGTDKVSAFGAADGQPLWTSGVAGKAFGLAVADGGLFVSTDEGAIYCFRAVDQSTPTPTPPFANHRMSATDTNALRFEVTIGPCLQFTTPNRAVVWWKTADPMPTRIEWGLEGEPLHVFEDQTAQTEHAAPLTGLRQDRVYSYRMTRRVNDKLEASSNFECDTAFNYCPPPAPDLPSPYPADDLAALYRRAAGEILARSSVTQGLCLVLDFGEGRLACELAKRSRLRIVGVDTDFEKVTAARRHLLQAGLYGARVVVHHVASLSNLPFTGQFANLIVSDKMLSTGESSATMSSVLHCLRPYGGVALLGQTSESPSRMREGQLETWLASCTDTNGFTMQVQGSWAMILRGASANAGEWSHEYGTAANAAYAGEKLGGASRTADLEVQWLGRPGPRVQADRNGRKPSPLATNGHLFMQGLHRILALDAFNGTILWTREIPALERFNVPRDCSNWCADEDHVYAAIRDQCWRLDAGSGSLSKLYPVMPGTRPGWKYDWGYLSIQGDMLIGSAVKKDSSYTEFWGGSDAGWYDATYGPATDKVCSENLFALDGESGQAVWRYGGGLMINSTITIGDGRLFFLESRQPKVIASDSDRLGLPDLWQDLWLVTVDLRTGHKAWEQRVLPASGQVVIYLAYGEGKLVLVTSGDKNYHIYAFAGSNGQSLWQSSFVWPSDNHGRHMSRPALVGGRVYVRPKVFDLTTGHALNQIVPDGGCGTYAATVNALFFRNSNETVWDLAHGTATSWARLRPDCWLSTVPAQGLLLSPEAGGGCSCGSWMETSIAFAPIHSR